MEVKTAVTALSALAQESRLRVFRLLARQGVEGLAAGRIAEQLEITPATLSFHLNRLSHAGLIVSRREGRSVIYGLSVEGIRSLMGFLIEDCCGGRPELCQPSTDCCNEKSVEPDVPSPRVLSPGASR